MAAAFWEKDQVVGDDWWKKDKVVPVPSGPSHDEEADAAAPEPAADVSTMASATRSVVDVATRAASVASYDPASARLETTTFRPDLVESVGTDEWGRPLDPRGRNPAQLNPSATPGRTPESALSVAMTPLLPIRKAFTQGEQLSYLAGKQPEGEMKKALTTAAGVVSGLEDVAGGAMEFMTSPVGISTMGLGAAPGALRSLASATFAADMISHAPEALKEFQVATTPEDKARALTKGIGNLALAGAASWHAIREAKYAAAGKAGDLSRALDTAPLTMEAVRNTVPFQPEPLRPLAPEMWSSSTVEPGKAIYLSNRQADAQAYSLGRPVEKYHPIVKKTFDPDVSTDMELLDLYDSEGGLYEAPQSEAFRDALIAKGYDSFKGTEVGAGGPAEWLVVFDPKNITKTTSTPLTTAATQAVVEKVPSALNQSQAATLHESLPPQPVTSEGQVPAKVGGKGVQSYDEAGFGKAPPSGVAPEVKKEPGVTPAPAPEAVTSESGKPAPAVTGAEPPPKARVAPEPPVAKPEGEPALTPADKPKLARGISGRTRLNAETERTGEDVLDFLANTMSVMSKTNARKTWGSKKFTANKSMWDDAPEKLQAIHHNSIYGTKGGALFAPDVVADAAFKKGLISDATPSALWKAVKEASAKRAGHGEQMKMEAEFLEKQGAADTAWREATSKGNIEVTAEDLKVGDFLEVEGEQIRVMNRDPGTGDLTLTDGTKFRTQTLQEGQKLYVEKFEPKGEEGIEFEPPDPGIDIGALGEKGMGGAKPAEFDRPGTYVSNMFAAIDSDRAANGKPPMPETQRRTWDEDNQKALARMNRDPDWIPNLIKQVLANPRPLLSWENAGMVWQRHKWRAEANNALRRIAEEYDNKRPDFLEEAKMDAKRFEDNLEEMDRAVGRGGTGTEAGRSLQAQKMASGEDFSLIEMRLEERASHGGRPLTDKESAEVKARYDELVKVQEELATVKAEREATVTKLEIDKAMAEARAAAAEATYEPRVLAAAEKFAKFMDKKGEDALARIKARLGRTSAGIDPTILSDVAILGAAKITRGVVDLGKWTDAMVRDLGEWFREHAAEAWSASQKVFEMNNDTFHKGVGKGTKEKITRAREDVAGRIEDVGTAIKAKAAKGEGSPMYSEVRKLVKLLVEQEPSISRDELIDAVHNVLSESVPGITRLEAMDAISGRGRFWTPDQGEVSKRVRDLSAQIRLVGHQMDVEAGKPLPRTGYQPEPLSDAARREQQILNDLKRRYGVVVTDPAAQLGSALAARKTYYTNRMSDLRAEISAGERIVKNRAAPPTDAALEALKAEYKQVKAEHDEIFGNRTLTDAQKLKLALAAAERNEVAWNERLADAKNGIFKKTEPGRKVTSPELEAIKDRTEAVKEEVKELKELAFPKKTPLERALQYRKTRLATEKADLTERIAKGDFSPRRKPPKDLPLDRETANLMGDVERLRSEFRQRLERHKYEQKTRGEKIWHGIKKTRGALVNIASSFDFSAPRQALQAMLGNVTRLITKPVVGARMVTTPFREMFRAWASERTAGGIEQQIKARPNAVNGADKIAGIEYSELNTNTFTKYEENAHSVLDEWAKLPLRSSTTLRTAATIGPKLAALGVRASNRAFVTFLNSTRAMLFDELLRVNFKDRAPTDLELKVIGNAVNVATGRGKLNPKTAAVASEFIWAPKLLAARVQALTGQPLWTGQWAGSGRARAIVAREYARQLTGAFLLWQVSRLFDDKREPNATASDYGKVVRGKTRVDPWGGFQQITTLAARVATETTTTLKGKEHDIGAAKKYGQKGLWHVMADFGRSKLRPDVGAAVDILTRSTYIGDKTTPGNVAQSLLVPLPMREITAVMKENGFTEGMIIEALGQFGAGVSVYEDREMQR